MADLSFGQFNPGGPAQTADIVPIERGGLNYRLTVSAISAFVNANLSAVKSLSNGTDTLSGAVQLIAGANITIAKTAANTFTLSSTGGGGGNVDSVNGKTGTVTLNTDDIPEGSTNKYLNQTALAAKYDKTGGTISGDVLVSRDENAGTVAIFVNNSNNTSGDSDAQIKITTAGANAGDPYATFTAYGVEDWSAGFNNQSGNFEIARANNLGNNTCLTIDGNNDVDIPSGTLSVSRDPVSAKEVATKAYIDSRSYDEGVNLLEIDADVTLTEISALLPVSPSVDGLKVLLPTMNYIRQKLSVGQTFQVLNVDFNSNSFDICYADGTVIKKLKALEMFEIMIQKNTTQGQDLYPYPKTLFILSETRGELGGLIILQPDDFYDDPNGNTHLVPSGGQAGQILQSNGSGQLPTFIDRDRVFNQVIGNAPTIINNSIIGSIQIQNLPINAGQSVNFTMDNSFIDSQDTPVTFSTILAGVADVNLVIIGTSASVGSINIFLQNQGTVNHTGPFTLDFTVRTNYS